MNAQKMFSLVTIFAALSAGAVSSYASQDTVAAPLPSVAAVLPDPLPLDMTHAPSIAPEIPIQTTTRIAIFGQAPKAPGKVWTCGEFRALANDASQTVRECGWK